MTLCPPFVFLLGLIIDVGARPGVAQDRCLAGNNGINQLAFVTPRYDEMMRSCTKTVGFPEAFSNKNTGGQPR